MVPALVGGDADCRRAAPSAAGRVSCRPPHQRVARARARRAGERRPSSTPSSACACCHPLHHPRRQSARVIQRASSTATGGACRASATSGRSSRRAKAPSTSPSVAPGVRSATAHSEASRSWRLHGAERSHDLGGRARRVGRHQLAAKAPGDDLGAGHAGPVEDAAVRHTPRRYAARRRPLRRPHARRTLRRRARRRPPGRPGGGRHRRRRRAQRRRPAGEIEDVWFGCANQAGEDNRNVARFAALLAGLPDSVGGVTVNRLCASGLSAVVGACHAVMAGDGDLFVAGGVESMTRAPLVTAKPSKPFERGDRTLHDTTLGWRFVNPAYARALLDRGDGRDRRERGRAVGRQPRGPGRVRAALAAALGGGRRGRPVRRRAGAGRRRRARRAPAARHHRREAGAR